MLVTCTNLDDAHRYYHQTFVEVDLNTGDGTRLYKINIGGGYVKYCDLLKGTVLSFPVNEPGLTWEIKYIMPGKTLVMVDDPTKNKISAVLLSRKLDKQYKRGISYENSVLTRFLETGPTDVEVSEKALALWSKRFVLNDSKVEKTDFYKALKDKTSNVTSVAFSDKVLVTKTGKLFVYETEVGILDFTHNLVTCNPLFYNEVVEALHLVGLTILSYRSELKGTR